MATLFKKCPSCGRRFEVKHIGEKLEKTEDRTETIQTAEALSDPVSPPADWTPQSETYSSRRSDIANADTIEVEPGQANASFAMGKEDIVIREDTYQETYRCSHCGYQWTEEHVKDKTLGRR
ncbi:MAG: hypothetical protein OK456_06770 [Thaumarchaeota archaeon]|nr:hypothetical protein [Nitrososphaerota archaeon]